MSTPEHLPLFFPMDFFATSIGLCLILMSFAQRLRSKLPTPLASYFMWNSGAQLVFAIAVLTIGFFLLLCDYSITLGAFLRALFREGDPMWGPLRFGLFLWAVASLPLIAARIFGLSVPIRAPRNALHDPALREYFEEGGLLQHSRNWNHFEKGILWMAEILARGAGFFLFLAILFFSAGYFPINWRPYISWVGVFMLLIYAVKNGNSLVRLRRKLSEPA